MTPPAWCPDADAMVLDQYIDLYSGIASVRIKIFTEEGKQKYANVAVLAMPEEIRARTIKPDGSTVEVKSSQIARLQEKARGRRVEETGEYRIPFPDVSVGCILEYVYNRYGCLTVRNLSSWSDYAAALVSSGAGRQADIRRNMTYLWATPFTYGRLPVRYSIISFTALESSEFDVIPTNVEKYRYGQDLKPQSLPEGRATCWKGLVSEYNVDYTEPFLPPRGYFEPHVYFVKKGEKYLSGKQHIFSGWKKAAENVQDALKDFMFGAGKLRPLYKRLSEGQTDSLQLARKLYTWVCDSLEYVDSRGYLDFGRDPETGDERTMSDRIKKHQATGAEKVLILKALYDLARFESYPLLVVPLDERRSISDMPVLGQFSTFTLAVNVNGNLIYLDPVEDGTPFGTLPWELRSAMALPIAAGTDTVTTIPPTRSPNVCQCTFHCKLTPEGALSVTGTLSLSEQFRLSYYRRLLLADASERRRILSREFLHNVDTTQFSRIDVRLDSVRSSICHIDVEFSIPEYATVLGDEMLLRPDCAVRLRHDLLPQDDKRQNDLYFGYPSSRVFTLTYELPPGYTYADQPVNFSEGGSAGLQYLASLNNDPETGQLVYQRSDSRNYVFYSASSYDIMRDYFNQLAEHDALEVVLKRKP